MFIWNFEQIKFCQGTEMDCSSTILDRHKIVEGEDPLWDGVSRPYRETIRAFLVYFQNQVFLFIDFLDRKSVV